MAGQRQLEGLGDFCASAAAVFCAHSPGMPPSAASMASDAVASKGAVDVGAALGHGEAPHPR